MILGKHQLHRLRALSHIDMAQVVGDKITAGLVRRGLLAADPDGSFARITPAGLRRLADEIEAGRIVGWTIDQLRRAQ